MNTFVSLHAAAVACLVPVGVSAQPTTPQPGDIGVSLSIVASGIDAFPQEWAPTDLAPFPDGSGRLLVQTLGGQLRVIDAGGNLLPTPLLTAAQSNNTVPASQEAGATGVAFHPDFAVPGAFGYGKFYTITTEPAGSGVADFTYADKTSTPVADHQDVVREWDLSTNGNTIGGNVLLGTPADSRVILRVDQQGPYHNVVDLAFSPTDGHLYLSSGDGNGVRAGDGGPGRFESQITTNIYGNVLRINPDTSLPGNVSDNGQYTIPSDNPFVGDAGFLPEIFAYGLRSPYRMNFDQQTGDLWLGDVGQGQREEINLIEAGGNYGWSLFEGTRPFDGNDATGLTFPVFEYNHNLGRSIVGGFIYRGDAIPELRGMYVFGDLGQNAPSAKLWYGDPETGEFFEFVIDPDGPVFPEIGGPGNPLPDRILSLGEDLDGELYILAGEDPRDHTPSAPGSYIIRIGPLGGGSLVGDPDGDGDIDDADLGIAFSNYTGPVGAVGGKSASQGDTDNDGDIDDGDLGTLFSNYTGPLTPASVPEPASAAVLLIGAGLVGRSRRRR
jgi:glucose/arabinose dehydrogenase